MRTTTARWLGALALTAAAFQSTGCEAIYVAVVLANDDDGDIDLYEEPTPLCVAAANVPQVFEPTTETFATAIRVAGNLDGRGIATADGVVFFVSIGGDLNGDYESIEDRDVSFEGSGTLASLDWEICPSLYNVAVVVAHPTTAGSGDITVSADGDELETFGFDVAAPTSMRVALDASSSTFEAQLADDAGNTLYAGDILWQFAPFTGSTPQTTGNTAILGVPFDAFGMSSQQEVVVTASRGDLSASITVRGVGTEWQIVQE